MVEHGLRINPRDRREHRERHRVAQRVVRVDVAGLEHPPLGERLHPQDMDSALEREREHVLLEAAEVGIKDVERHLPPCRTGNRGSE
jgi:hypothetical protein